MSVPSMSATGGAAGPATSGAQGGGNGTYFGGNGMTINKTSPWVWAVLIVFAIVLLLAVL